MKRHFGVLDRHEVSSALTQIWRELSDLVLQFEELESKNAHIATLKRALDDVNSAEIHFSKFNGRQPKGLFVSRSAEADEDVRFIAGAAYDLANLIAQSAQTEMDKVRERHA